MPHTTTKVTRLVLEDSNGKAVVDIRIPEEQQTRFTFDGSDLLNRIRIPLEQSSKPSGRLSSVQRVRLYRAGNSNLDNINPAKHKDVFWVLTSLRFRRGCKGRCRAGTAILLVHAPHRHGLQSAGNFRAHMAI